MAAGLASAGDSQGTTHRLIDRQRLQAVKEQVADLKERVKAQKQSQGGNGIPATLEALQAKVTALEGSMTTIMNADSTLLTTLQAAQGQISTMQGQLASLQTRLTALEGQPAGGGVPDLEKYVTIDPNPINGVNGPHLLITGVNVHIRSGSQTTDDGGSPRGLGNLIIGYNEVNPASGFVRTGSHNLVLGRMNGFSSVGGAVMGQQNRITGQYATVHGGEMNLAGGLSSSILGGWQNTASGVRTTVYGGFQNTSALPQSYTPAASQGCSGC
jgi:hypothetical protein